MSDCLFCRILSGEIPSAKVYEDENVYAFRDIHPQAPTHILVIPREHIPSVAALTAENSHHAARCLEAVARIAEQEGLSGGYRVISNCGPHACQSVPHLHFHILGGTQMADRMA